MAAVPELGRAAGLEARAAPEAAAAHALFERYARQIYGFCLHQLGSREEAEDAVQTTFMNAFRGLRRGVSPEAESAWLFKIAHNVCLTRRRSASRRGQVETASDINAIQEFVAAPEPPGTDELMELDDALAAMPQNQRKAILLREWRGLSYREIADHLGVTQAAVETLIFRARRSLARGLEAAPAEQRRLWKRLRNGLDLGPLLAVLKTVLSGGAAAKVATTAAVTATAVVAASPMHERLPRRGDVAASAPEPALVAERSVEPVALVRTPVAAVPVAAPAEAERTRATAPATRAVAARAPTRGTKKAAAAAAVRRPSVMVSLVAPPAAKSQKRAAPKPPAPNPAARKPAAPNRAKPAAVPKRSLSVASSAAATKAAKVKAKATPRAPAAKPKPLRASKRSGPPAAQRPATSAAQPRGNSQGNGGGPPADRGPDNGKKSA